MVSGRKSSQAPDTGWSWVIAASCCFINAMMYGMARLAGVLFVATLKKFHVPRSQASLPYSLSSTVRNVSGPLVGLLGHIFGVRLVTVFGGLIGAAGIAMCFFAHNVTWITIFWGGVFGFGFGLGNVLLPVAINQYFDKHRATASGIALSGACFGSFLLPPLVDVLFGEYGLDGAFLVISGLVLNCVPFAMLLRKPTFVIQPPRRQVETNSCYELGTQPKSHMEKCSEETNLENTEKFQPNAQDSLKVEIYSENSRKMFYVNPNFIRDEIPESDAELNSKNVALENKLDLSLHNKDIKKNNAINNLMNSYCTETHIDESSVEVCSDSDYIISSVTNVHITHNSQMNCSNNLSHASINEQEPFDVLSKGKENLKEYSIKSYDVSDVPQTTTNNSFRKSLKLIANPMFILISISVALYGFTFVCMVTSIVDFALDIGVEDSRSKYVLMCFSVGDLIGRLGLGWITDRGHMTKAGFSSMCFVLQGLTAAAVAWTTGFWSLMVTMFVYGVFEAGLIIIFPLLVAQYIDEDLQTLAIPSSNVLYGPACLAVPPVIGYFREQKGSYKGVFYSMGAISFACAVAWLGVPYFDKRRKKSNKN